MYYNDNENMDEDQYGEDVQPTQEDSQQATQGSSQEDGGVTYNAHLWASFIPVNECHPRFDLWRSNLEYTLGRSQQNNLIMTGPKISTS